MHSIQQLRWRDVLNDVLFSSDLSFEWIKLSFEQGFQTYDRDGLYVTGAHGIAEVSPLPGYFDREIECLLAGIDTVSHPWPNKQREEVDFNSLVSNDYDLIPEVLDRYSSVKVKVHTVGDCARVKKVRDLCGPTKKIRIDCNGRFNVAEAQEILKELQSVGLELIEQPCRSNVENAELRREIDIPLAIDETARTHKEVAEAIELDAADVLVIKIQTSGGLHRAIELVDQWGGDVIVGHMMETQVGIDVGMRLAQSLDEQKYANGLAGPRLENVIREPLNI
ncbi:MAG TPA: enolase C-terminal domain-like protein [Acidimicrobiia bacterium]|nr:enolase C-terminal domain-like protein [Acidimicrobiia bacterium]